MTIAPIQSIKLLPDYAGFWKRLAALSIDTLILLPLSWAALGYGLLYLHNYIVCAAFVLLWFLYKPLCEYFFGFTLGKRVLKIKVVRDDSKRANLAQIFLRNILYSAPILFSLYTTISWFENPAFEKINSFEELNNFMADPNNVPWAQAWYSFLFYADVAFLLTDKQKRALHDRTAGTYVVQV